MITAQNNLIGRISSKQNITGKLNNAVVREYPELEDLTVTPTANEQNFKSSKYGFNNVTVKGIDTEELNIVPTTTDQVKEGLYNKVTVAGESNLLPENIKSGTSIFGVVGTMEGSWDTSQIRSCTKLFNNNTTMIVAPFFDTNGAKSMEQMFYSCSSLIEVPKYDTSNTTNMTEMFYNCTSLQEIPLFDTSSVTNMDSMFQYCMTLTTIPLLDMSKVQRVSRMFYNCPNLKTIPKFNLSKVRIASSMFEVCPELDTLPELDMSSCASISSIINGCKKLINMGGFVNLGKGYTQKSNNYYNYKLSLTSCINLTHESLMNVINNLYDLNLTYDVENGGTLYVQSLVLGAKNLAKLTAEEIAIATNKRLDSFLERREYEIFFLYKTKNDSSR